MKKIILAFLLAAAASSAFARTLSDIERAGSWYYLYDENGRKFRSINVSSAGELVGFSSQIFITRSGSWYRIYDADAKLIRSLPQSSVGDITAVTGDTFTSKKGSWTRTYDKSGKLLRSR